MTPSVPALTALASNAAILLALLALSDLLPRRPQRPGRLVTIAVGLALGGLAVALMASAYAPVPGIIIDSRGVLLSTAGLFFGTIPTVTAMLVAAAYRVYAGGAGAWYGVAAILAAGGAGLAWRRVRHDSLARIGGVELFGLGTLVHVGTVVVLLLLQPLAGLGGVLLSVLVVMPLATVVVGRLLVRQLRRHEVVRALRESQAQSDRLRMEAERSRDELMRAVAQRFEAEEALRDLNADLEQRVAERTRDLAVARDEAEASNRVKNMFLATMSHELRTPLNSIIGFSDLLLHGLAGPLPGEQRTQIEIINRSGRTLLAVISDLLDVSKIEAGKLVLELQRVSLTQLVEQQWQSAAIQAQARHLELHPPEGPAGVMVCADPQRLRQVLGNLLSNAIKYTDRGSITGGWGVDGTRATVWVRDTGIGIPGEHRALLFRPFHRVEGARSRTREGTGLGLAICDRLVREMGGEIGYESTPGVGSTFWFSLPLALAEPAGAPRVTAGTAA